MEENKTENPETKETKKSPYINFSWVVYIVLIVFGCIIAKTMFDTIAPSTKYLNIYVYDVLLLLYGFISCSLFYQLGKLLFGKIAGYHMVYFNFYLIGFQKENGKTKTYFGGRREFSCRVGLAPSRENANYKLMSWGGTIALGVVAALTYVLIFVLNASDAVKFFFILSSFFYLFAFVIYMIPLKMDHINDGFGLLLIHKDHCADVFHRNMLNEEAMINGQPVVYEDYGEALDPVRMEGNIYNYFYLLDSGENEKAAALAEFLSKNNKYLIEEDSVNTALVGNIYHLCQKHQFEELEQYYWKLDTTTRHILTDRKNYESIKTSLYISTFIDVNFEEYEKIMKSKEKAKNAYRYPSRIDAETARIEAVEKEVLTEHPEWAE